jgi:hypothetical protein
MFAKDASRVHSPESCSSRGTHTIRDVGNPTNLIMCYLPNNEVRKPGQMPGLPS